MGRRGRQPVENINIGRILIDKNKLIKKNEMSIRFKACVNKPREYLNLQNVTENFKNVVLSLSEDKMTDISHLRNDYQFYLKRIMKDALIDNLLLGTGNINDVTDIVLEYDKLFVNIKADGLTDDNKLKLKNIVDKLMRKGLLKIDHIMKLHEYIK